MLTYCLSSRAHYIVPPLKKIVAAQIVESLWNATSRPEKLCPHWEASLTNHRVKTTIASYTFIESNNLPSDLKTFFKERVYSLHQAYSHMIRWQITYNIIDGGVQLPEESMHCAPNYFTVDGEFDDLAWTKRVVLDPNYPIQYRFNLACLYWFENESAMLWSELKMSDLVPCDGDLYDIREEMEKLITLRIFQLENQAEALAEDPRFAGNFYEVAFKEAARRGFVNATLYFWQKLDELEKKSLISNDSFFYLINAGLDYPHDKVSIFLYSLLSKERKEMFLDWSIEHRKLRGWLNLLLSPFTEAVRSEITKFVYQLPDDLYSYVLDFTACRIRNDKLPLDCKMFEVLWTKLSLGKRDEMLKENPSITAMLIEEEWHEFEKNCLATLIHAVTGMYD